MAEKRQPGDRWNCQACDEPLIGAQTQAGHTAPICLEPSPDGNILLFRGPTFLITSGIVCSRVLKGATLAELRTLGVPLHLSHFANCPQAERFKHSPEQIEAAIEGEA